MQCAPASLQRPVRIFDCHGHRELLAAHQVPARLTAYLDLRSVLFEQVLRTALGLMHDTLTALADDGFRVIVIVPGHYGQTHRSVLTVGIETWRKARGEGAPAVWQASVAYRKKTLSQPLLPTSEWNELRMAALKRITL